MTANDTGPSDSELWARVQCGDHEAFAVVYRRHWEGIARHLARRVPADDVEDLLATVFLEAWRQRATLEVRDRRGLLPWLYTVARNSAAGHLARRRREFTLSRNEHSDIEADHAGTIADEAEREWRIRVAQRALASLSDPDQEILDLCLTDGLTPSEAAAVLGIAPVAARSRLHRARIRLAAEFTELSRTREVTHASD